MFIPEGNEEGGWPEIADPRPATFLRDSGASISVGPPGLEPGTCRLRV